MECTFLEEIVKVPGQHVVFRLLTESSYDIHIRGEPLCTCLDFQNREKSQKPFVAFKHMYYLYVQILGLHPKERMVIHQSTFTPSDIVFLLGQPRNLQPNL